MNRRSFLLATASASVLAGCVSVGGSAGPPAPAPVYRIGDRWVYRAQDGFRVPVTWEETQEIVAVGPDGISARITQIGPTVDSVRTETWAAPGIVTVGAVFDNEIRRFGAPLKRYDFPLAPGAIWNQWLANYNETARRQGVINRYVRVGGWDRIATPAGTFDALRLRVLMHLDDEEFWRYATDCNYEVWYAPEVGASVREVKRADYLERGDIESMFRIRSQNAVLELVSYRRGG
ncbi:MAG: hypothetical protein ACR2HE_05445 [Casimicrobiaceae bacterium]